MNLTSKTSLYILSSESD